MKINVEPNYVDINDDDLICLVAWCEKWKPEKVYKVAYKQAHMDPFYEYPQWALLQKRLPAPVRLELQNAAKINYDSGKMWKLQVAHCFYVAVGKLFRYGFYGLLVLVLLYLISR